MAEITAGLVKQLRDKTGAGMMDCKKALTETDGDLEKAVLWLREKGISKAQGKADRVAVEGLTKVVTDGNRAVMIEVNSETDFVARNDQFLTLIDQITGAILASDDVKTLADVEALKVGDQAISDLIINATATIGERISLRRFEVVEKQNEEIFGAYIHMGGKISALAVLKNANEEVAKDIAMQVASMSPQFISRDYMDEAFIANEKTVQAEIIKNDASLAGKPEKVLAGIVEGRLSKSLQDISLMDQVYFKNQDLTVSKFLAQSSSVVTYFVRYAVGEGMEKPDCECAC